MIGLMKSELKHFCADEEKMYDFCMLSKDEFLESYSYLTEYEYDKTAKKVMDIMQAIFSD